MVINDIKFAERDLILFSPAAMPFQHVNFSWDLFGGLSLVVIPERGRACVHPSFLGILLLRTRVSSGMENCVQNKFLMNRSA